MILSDVILSDVTNSQAPKTFLFSKWHVVSMCVLSITRVGKGLVQRLTKIKKTVKTYT